MKIVLTDAQTVVDELVNADPLRELGDVVEHGLLPYEEVAENIADADVVVCNKTVLDAHSLRLAKNLKYIGLFATGYNNIDIEYCSEHGIAVCNAGSYSTNAVAQHTFALILEAFNNTSHYNKYVHDGLWKRSATFSPFVYPLNELAGKTLGIVGLGAIGTAVAKIANAFEMKVLGFNRSEKHIDGVENVGFAPLYHAAEARLVFVRDRREAASFPLKESAPSETEPRVFTARLGGLKDRLGPGSYDMYFRLVSLKYGGTIRTANQGSSAWGCPIGRYVGT